jgi:hypothetical protein
MKRRKPSEAAVARPKPPSWIVHRVVGLLHIGGRDAVGDLVLGEEVHQKLQESRDEWCRTKGCWRPGTKTCVQAGSRPCDAGTEEARRQ